MAGVPLESALDGQLIQNRGVNPYLKATWVAFNCRGRALTSATLCRKGMSGLDFVPGRN